MVSVGGFSPTLIAEELDRARVQAVGPIGANILLVNVDPDTMHDCLKVAAGRAKVVDFFWGDPDAALVNTVHAGGALACWQVGSREEAIAAARAGCDLIVAQGIEAGGHVRGRIGLLALLSQVLDAVNVPVIAAGGIGTGRAMAAVLAAGAAGVRVGTRFVAAEEAGAHPAYVQALIDAEPEDTVYTETFSANWPDAPHRVLRASQEAAEAFQGDVVGQRFSRAEGQWIPVRRFGPIAISQEVTGAIEAMSQWAGESVGGVKRVQPAAQIVHELAGEAEQLLRRWG
jgi:nitronate monooxygenase